MGAFLTLLTERIHAGKAAGELPADLEPEIVVQIIATFLQGLWRTALVSYDRKQVERQIDVLLTSLGLRAPRYTVLITSSWVRSIGRFHATPGVTFAVDPTSLLSDRASS